MAHRYLDWRGPRISIIALGALLLSVIFTIWLKPFFAPSSLTFEFAEVYPDQYTVYVNSGQGYNEKEQRSVRVQDPLSSPLIKFE